MKPCNILHVTRSVDGGASVVVDQLVRRVDTRLYVPIILFATDLQSNMRSNLSQTDIKTISLNHCSSQQNHAPFKLRKSRDIAAWLRRYFGKTMGDIYIALKAFGRFLLRDIPRIRLFIRVIKDNSIKLIHTHADLNLAHAEIIAAWLTGVPCIVHIHAYSNLTYFDKIFARIVHTFVYISNDVAKHHIFQVGRVVRYRVIHNGIDVRRFAIDSDVTLIRKEFNVEPNDLLVGIIGRLVWWKGHEYFLEAIAEVTKYFPGLKGLIIGDLDTASCRRQNLQYLHNLRTLVKSFELQKNVIFTGFRSDVDRLTHALDVVVHASSEPEPFGLVVVEGMAAGKPVVATAAGGVLDIIENGVNGLLVPPKNSKAMARAILQIMSDKNRSKQMGEAALTTAYRRFTIEEQVNSTQDLYHSILGVC